ncbi:MAG: ABC transporter permease [Actinobacteria bacterium]|nr:ABC transporter permease [Actinomycetota bacterium]
MRRAVPVVARQELALIRSEYLPFAIYFVMPLVILAFVQGVFEVYLRLVEGQGDVSGADLAAPGQATMFGFMTLAGFGYLFLGEHGWGTWNRVRALGVRPWQIMTGKLSVAYILQLTLFAFVMIAAVLLFDLEVRGSIVALVMIELATALVIIGYGLIAAAVANTQALFNAFAYLGALLLAGLGGALVPFSTLPGWARAIAPATPTYWAVSAYEQVILDGGGLADVVTELAVLLLFAVGFLLVGAWLFDPDKRRTTWA